MVWPRQKDTRGQNTKIDYGMDTRGEKKKRTSKKNVDGRITISHDNKKFRTKSVEKQEGMAFGFRKTATAIVAVGLTQPLTEMSTRNISWRQRRPVLRADNLATFMCRLS
jgi:hypothetical protein